MRSDRLGAYGLSITRLAGAHGWMQPQPSSSPWVALRATVGHPDDGPSRYDDQSADLRLLGGGRLRLHCGAKVAEYVLPSAPSDADLLHPYLAPAAALLWRWAGQEAIHAGGFAGRAGAVLLLGGKAAGKSTTLAWLANSGVPVLTDDLAVVNGGEVLAGPRSLDLRPSSAAPAPRPDHVVRRGERSRVTLPPAPHALPLAGMAVLEWGERHAVTTVPIEQRWELLAAQRYFPALGANAMTLLDLVSVPTVRVTRPPDLTSLDQSGSAIIDAFG